MSRVIRRLLLPGVVAGVLGLASPLWAQMQQPGGRPGWPCAGKVDPTYVRTSEATGGKLMLFTTGEITGAAEEITASQRHPQTILRVSDRFDSEARDYVVPVDSTVESVYFFVTLQCLDRVTVVGPDGEEVRAGAPGVEIHTFQAVRLFTIASPAPGDWTVKTAGRGVFSLIASAKSKLSFSSAIVENGRPTSALPTPGTQVRLQVRVPASVQGPAFQFLAPNGDLKQALRLEPGEANDEDRVYSGDVTLPNADYRLAVVGYDAKGLLFQRVDGRYFVVAR